VAFIKNNDGNRFTDAELVNQYQAAGDLETLATLYQRYMEQLYGVCLKYLKEPENAQDAVMQIFEELIVKLKKHRVENFRSWLYTLARNFCLMQLRTPRNLKTVHLTEDGMYSLEEMHLNGIPEQEDNLQKMEKCLQTLVPDQKQAVELFYLQQKCYREISLITGLEWNKVRSCIQNGRRNLKLCMEKNITQKVAGDR
jgi:RNA polymerase sigma-70 factor (ECF subfamily)